MKKLRYDKSEKNYEEKYENKKINKKINKTYCRNSEKK